MKKFVSIALVFVMILTCSTVAYAAETVEPLQYEVPTVAEADNASPWIFHRYEKEITREYTSYSSVPEYYYYEEYDDVVNAWFTGTLSLQSVVKTSRGTWLATYKGYLSGQI